jgi:hypothetical protein
VQLTVAAVARPVRSSMVPLVLLAAELSWGCCSPRRYLPGGASSRHPASGVAVVDIARTPAMASVAGRCPACGVQPPIRGRPGSGCPAVRCPASPVFGHLGSLSGVRLSGPSAVHPSSPLVSNRPVSTRPVSNRLLSTRPVSSRLLSARRSGRVRLLPHRTGALGPGWCRGGNRHRRKRSRSRWWPCRRAARLTAQQAWGGDAAAVARWSMGSLGPGRVGAGGGGRCAR